MAWGMAANDQMAESGGMGHGRETLGKLGESNWWVCFANAKLGACNAYGPAQSPQETLAIIYM